MTECFGREIGNLHAWELNLIHFNIKFMRLRHKSRTSNWFLVFDSCMHGWANLMHRICVSLPAGHLLHFGLVSEILTKVPRGHGRSLKSLSSFFLANPAWRNTLRTDSLAWIWTFEISINSESSFSTPLKFKIDEHWNRTTLETRWFHHQGILSCLLYYRNLWTKGHSLLQFQCQALRYKVTPNFPE